MSRMIKPKVTKIVLSKVESSTVAAIGFHSDSMYVKYIKGAIYKWGNFPKEVFTEIKDSKSIGGALWNTGVKGILISDPKILKTFIIK